MRALPPYIFPDVSWFLAGMQQGSFQVSMGGRFEKQTPRTRYTIAGPNGLQTLSVPVNHDGSRQLADISINREQKWVKEHIRAIETAYGNAPFFEFYDYRLLPLLSDESLSLAELIQQTITVLHRELKCGLPLEFQNSGDILTEFPAVRPYSQVFDDRFGFRSGVSALDLLFNLGPEAGDYLLSC